MKKFILFLFIVVVIGLTGYFVYAGDYLSRFSQPASAELKVHFIDVGQGDAILIDYGPAEVLIDGGDKGSGVWKYLKSYVDGDLEAIVATHTHADHIGGLIDVLAEYKVDEIWLNGDTSTSTTYQNFVNAVNIEGSAIYRATLGNVIKAGDLQLTVLNPPKQLFPDANNNSIVLRLDFGEVAFLFMGDAEAEAEEAILNQTVVPLGDIEILKVGHHASRTASTVAFLSVISPDLAIYMAGKGNVYGHPHMETLVNLYETGARIFGTDVHGTIMVSTDGKTYHFYVQKQAPMIVPSVSVSEMSSS